jgi:tetratricopeptide (TPR) repeat protein
MTGYTRPVFDKSLIAVGYARDTAWGKPNDKEWDGNAPYWHLKGNGGILSTTEDLYNWDKALKSKRILSETAKQKLFHPKLRADEKENSYYAYGWDVSKTSRNTTQIWHNGSNRIFYADFLRYPDENVTLIMLSNKFHQDFNPVNREISGIIFTKGYTPEIPAEDNKINRDFTSKILETIQNPGLEAAKKEYLSKDAEVHLLEFKMRNQGFQHIDNNKPDVAIQIFEMNVFAYPNSAKALQGLGEGYMETGNKELALKYFNQSLRINPENNFVKDMIQKLEE